MITENMGLVYMVAKRFANRGTDLQDLTQIGVIGLIKAIDRFETPLLNHIALKQAIDQLPEKEAQLIKFRYMDNLSQAETAKRMGKNQVSVSRSERKILEKLRRKML